jgi:hypothetical protein
MDIAVALATEAVRSSAYGGLDTDPPVGRKRSRGDASRCCDRRRDRKPVSTAAVAARQAD